MVYLYLIFTLVGNIVIWPSTVLVSHLSEIIRLISWFSVTVERARSTCDTLTSTCTKICRGVWNRGFSLHLMTSITHSFYLVCWERILRKRLRSSTLIRYWISEISTEICFQNWFSCNFTWSIRLLIYSWSISIVHVSHVCLINYESLVESMILSHDLVCFLMAYSLHSELLIFNNHSFFGFLDVLFTVCHYFFVLLPFILIAPLDILNRITGHFTAVQWLEDSYDIVFKKN